MKGVDFGRYTEYGGSQIAKQQVDFVIAGLTSGDYFTEKGKANIEVVKAEPVKMLYHSYEFTTNWLPQVDIVIEAMWLTGAYGVWWDHETSGIPGTKNYRLTNSMKRVSLESAEAVYALKEEFNGRAGWYLNFSDYYQVMQYAPKSLANSELWIAFPHGSNQYPRPGYISPEKFWPKTGRPEGDWLIHQYSWVGPSEDYGVANYKEKKGIDLDFVNPNRNLLEWLGITEVGPPENGDLDALKALYHDMGVEDAVSLAKKAAWKNND